VSRVTPTIHTRLGYKMFLMFATLNVGAMAPFILLIPETKGRSLEEMDIIFGTVNTDDRAANIARQEQGISNTVTYDGSNDADLIDNKSDNDWQLSKTP